MIFIHSEDELEYIHVPENIFELNFSIEDSLSNISLAVVSFLGRLSSSWRFKTYRRLIIGHWKNPLQKGLYCYTGSVSFGGSTAPG